MAAGLGGDRVCVCSSLTPPPSQLAGVGIALAYFFVDNSPGSGYRKTIEYIILTIQPFYVVFGSLINSFCPNPNYTSHKAFGLLGLFNIQFITAVRLYAYYETNEGALAPGVGLSLIFWPLFYSICKNKASKLPQKLNHNVNLINHHNLTMIPIFAVSTLLSLLYMSSESFSCLFDDNHYGMAVTNCQDEINSNETVMMFFAMAVYLKLYTIPHMEEDYSLADVMRLNFTSARDQLLLIFTAIVGLFALFIFSSSTLEWDRVTCTSEFCIDSCPPTKNSTTIKFAIFNEEEAQIRETYITFCIVSVALVPVLMLLNKKRMKWLRDQIKTTILGRLSPLYCIILDLGCFIGIGLACYYVKLASTPNPTWQDAVLINKWRITSESFLFVLDACALFRLFANPKSTRKREKLSALYPLIFLALLYVGNYLERETELELNKYKNVTLFIAYIPLVVIALKSRVMLSKTTPQVINNHVQRIFVLGVQVRISFF